MAEQPILKDLVGIPRLQNGNYQAWYLRVKAFLNDKNCWTATDPGFGEELSAEQ